MHRVGAARAGQQRRVIVPGRAGGAGGGAAGGAARREREGEEGKNRGEGKLTSGLDDRRQPLTGIQPRVRGGRERWKRGRGRLLYGKVRMRGGDGARLWERG
jgi:hypothetical protein